MNRALNPLKIAKKVRVAQNTCSLADKDIIQERDRKSVKGNILDIGRFDA